ncbi:MAG: type III secretion system stator protein SctL [Alphaproteobacteria bacterium GM202ARS2]|nr:type III secretion system stator protein SctL [Alphaproteobacteria bacterium GM202ARS2]
MALAIRLNKTLNLAPEVRRLSAQDYCQLQRAQQVVDEARAMAEAIKKAAETIYQQKKDEGYQLGKQQAQQRMAEQTIATVARTIDYMTNTEERMIDIVMDAIHKVLHSVPERDVVRGIVHACLSNARGQQRMTLRVNAAQAPIVKKELDSLMRNKSLNSIIQINGERALAKNSAILESEMGVIDSSLDVQLAALRSSITTMLKTNKNDEP